MWVSGSFLVFDGLLLLALGRTYLRVWRVGSERSPYRRAVSWFLRRPSWLLRAMGAAEAALGLAVLSRVSVGVRTLYRAIARFYDRIAPVWAEWGYPEACAALDRTYADYLPEGGHVLDLGCGTGANLERLMDLELHFGSYTGVDLSEHMLARARAKFGPLPSVRFERLDLAVDPLPDRRFDLVVSTWVFEHLSEPARVATKAWDRLRPGGHMVLLFEVKTDARRDRVVDAVWRFFSARLLREEEYRHIPGLISLRRFAGIGPMLALLVSRKPDERSHIETSQTTMGADREEIR